MNAQVRDAGFRAVRAVALLSFWIACFTLVAYPVASQVPEYKATPDKLDVRLTEGQDDVVNYVVQNISPVGRPIYLFAAPYDASLPVRPDDTDSATVTLFGGPPFPQMILPGDPGKFSYFVATDRDGTETPVDFGVQIFSPTLNIVDNPDLAKGHFVDGLTVPFRVTVVDVPEASSILLFASAALGPLGCWWLRRKKAA